MLSLIHQSLGHCWDTSALCLMIAVDLRFVASQAHVGRLKSGGRKWKIRVWRGRFIPLEDVNTPTALSCIEDGFKAFQSKGIGWGLKACVWLA